jgi:GntR family transcriptional regulator
LQVHAHLSDRIVNGTWKPGASLPNEQELAREFGVSAGTMRKALDKLEADHLVVRRQGKGTFVVDCATQELAVRFSNVVNAKGERIVSSRSTVLAQEAGLATEIEREHLAIEEGERVLRTRRVHYNQDRPYIYEEARLAVSRLPGLQGDDVVGDYLIVPLAQRYGAHLMRAVEKITVTVPPAEDGKLLAVQSGTPLLKLHRVVFAMDDRPVEWRTALCSLQNEYYLVDMK